MLLPLFFLTPVLAATVSRRDVAPASNLPSGWQYAGCFTDSTSARSLSAAFTYDNAGLTAQSCIAFCASKGYPVAGTEYSAECYCGASVPRVISGNCNMPCTGDGTQACGGPNALSVYSNQAAAVVTNPGPPGWTSLGCWTDDVQARTLSYRANTPSVLTVQTCTSACQASGSSYAGVEYSAECYCGNVLNNQRPAITSTCTMTCSGNSSEYCGGPNRLNLYQINSNTVTTSTTTTATTTTTTSASLATSTTSSASSSAPIYPANPTCAAYFSSYGIDNGGFESDFRGWTSAGNRAAGQVRLYRDTPPYEGCSVLAVIPSSDTSSSRSYSIASGYQVNPGSMRTVSFYVGRRSGAAHPLVDASITVQFVGSSGPSYGYANYAVCGSSSNPCNVQGADGGVWQKYSYTFYSNVRYQLSMQLSVFWGSGTVASDGRDDVLIDGIVIS